MSSSLPAHSRVVTPVWLTIRPRPPRVNRSVRPPARDRSGAEVLRAYALDELPELADQIVLVRGRVGLLVALKDDSFGVDERLLGIDGGPQAGGQGDGIRRPGRD